MARSKVEALEERLTSAAGCQVTIASALGYGQAKVAESGAAGGRGLAARIGRCDPAKNRLLDTRRHFRNRHQGLSDLIQKLTGILLFPERHGEELNDRRLMQL